MNSAFIQSVQAEAGLVDSLVWTVGLRIDLEQPVERVFVTRWTGDIVFSRENIRAGSPAGPVPTRARALRAAWVSEPEQARRFSGSNELTGTFRSELPGDSLDRLERFRNGGRLFARLEGWFRLLWLSEDDAHDPTRPLSYLFDRGAPRIWWELRGPSYELTRDGWFQVLADLRSPTRVLLEATLPTGTPFEEHGKRAIAHLAEAQRAFDDARHDETARLAYKAVEALQALGERVEGRYGGSVRRAFTSQCKALKDICHPERHDESRTHEPPRVDRVLAEHILLTAKSLAAVAMSPVSPP